MENQSQKNMQAIEGDKLNPDKTKILDAKSMEEITGRAVTMEYNEKRVIYNYPDATTKIDNPNSLANVFKRILKR